MDERPIPPPRTARPPHALPPHATARPGPPPSQAPASDPPFSHPDQPVGRNKQIKQQLNALPRWLWASFLAVAAIATVLICGLLVLPSRVAPPAEDPQKLAKSPVEAFRAERIWKKVSETGPSPLRYRPASDFKVYRERGENHERIDIFLASTEKRVYYRWAAFKPEDLDEAWYDDDERQHGVGAQFDVHEGKPVFVYYWHGQRVSKAQYLIWIAEDLAAERARRQAGE